MNRAKLTAAEFDRSRTRLRRFTGTTLDIARAVLVGGLGTSEAAARFKTSRQRVHGIVQRVQAAIVQVPSNWRRVEVWLPPRLANRVKSMARRARADWLRRQSDMKSRRAARLAERSRRASRTP